MGFDVVGFRKFLTFFCLVVLPFFGKSQSVSQESVDILNYVDSLIDDYHATNVKLKREASLPIWCLVNQELDHHVDLSEQLNKIDTNELMGYINAECDKPQNQVYANDFRLLVLRKKAEAYPEVKTNLNPKDLTTQQKAIYWNVTAPRREQFDNSIDKPIHYYQKSLKYADTIPNLMGLRHWLYRDIGYYYFHNHQLDSAIEIYQKQRDESIKAKRKTIDYVKGFGFYVNRVGRLGQAHMHVAMCTEKKGNLTEAIRLYDIAIEHYLKTEDFVGVCWGKAQLINSFTDLGDVERAQFLFRELVDYVQAHEGSIDLENQYLRSALTELGYYDLVQMAHFIQPILNSIETASGALHFGPKDVGDGSRYFRLLVVYSYQVLIKNLSAGTNINPSYLDSFERIADLHKNRIDTVSQGKELATNNIRALNLAWKIGLSDRGLNQNFEELSQFMKDKGVAGNSNLIYKMSLMILHANKKYKQEIDLLLPHFKTLKEGGFIIDRIKLHYQTSKAYEGLGNTEKALSHFKQYESLWRATLTMSHHSQLAEFDKKLEVERERNTNEILLRENELLSSKRIWWIVISICLVLVFAFALVAYYNSKQRLKVEQYNKTIELQLMQKDILKKDNALENTTYELVKSNGSFNKLLNNIDDLSSSMKPEVKRKVKSMLLDFKDKLQNETWQQFNLNFQNSNTAFYKQLREFNGSLTETELKIAALHVSGLSNKEIASITGQQLSSLHTHKSNLRKKVGTKNDADLLEKLEQFKQV